MKSMKIKCFFVFSFRFLTVFTCLVMSVLATIEGYEDIMRYALFYVVSSMRSHYWFNANSLRLFDRKDDVSFLLYRYHLTLINEVDGYGKLVSQMRRHWAPLLLCSRRPLHCRGGGVSSMKWNIVIKRAFRRDSTRFLCKLHRVRTSNTVSLSTIVSLLRGYIRENRISSDR